MSTNVGQKQVRVLAGTGTLYLPQVSITGATGPQWPQWQQLTAAQFAAGPTGQFETVQATNTGYSGGQENKTVSIPGYLGPS